MKADCATTMNSCVIRFWIAWAAVSRRCPRAGTGYGSCSGHALNNAVLHALLKDEAAWAWDTIEEDETVENAADWTFEPAMASAKSG